MFLPINAKQQFHGTRVAVDAETAQQIAVADAAALRDFADMLAVVQNLRHAPRRQRLVFVRITVDAVRPCVAVVRIQQHVGQRETP